MSGPTDGTGGDRPDSGSDDATQRLPGQPGSSDAAVSPPDAGDPRHSKLVGYMSVPVHRLLPIRRSTLLMVVGFVGFGILLHLYPPQSAVAANGGTFIKGADGQEYFVPSATKVSLPTTTTTAPTSTTTTTVRPNTSTPTTPTTPTTVAGHSSTTTTTTFVPSSTTTTAVPSTTTTTTSGSSDTTTTTTLGGTSSTTVP